MEVEADEDGVRGRGGERCEVWRNIEVEADRDGVRGMGMG